MPHDDAFSSNHELMKTHAKARWGAELTDEYCDALNEFLATMHHTWLIQNNVNMYIWRILKRLHDTQSDFVKPEEEDYLAHFLAEFPRPLWEEMK